jgi:multidrug efflux pump subunit AcrA (membrane-fusion protein)
MTTLSLAAPSRGRVAGAAVLLLAAAIVAAIVGLGALPQRGSAAEETITPATSTAEVERRTLVSQEEYEGTLGYSGELRVVNEIATSGAADIATLTQAVVSAQAAYDNAVRTLAAIQDPTPQSIANAQAQVRSAEAALLSAQIAAKGSTQAQIEAAAAQVAQAQAALLNAKKSANGPSATELAQAQAQLAQAQAALLAAQNAASGPTTVQRTQAEAAVAQAQIALTADQQALDAARSALAACQSNGGAKPNPDPTATPEPTPSPVDCSSAETAVTQAEARVASDQQSLVVAQAQLAALTSPQAQSEAAAALASAQAQLATAQAALDALTGDDATTTARAQLAAAEAAARSAQAALDELTSPDAKAQRDAQVNTAKAQLTAARISLAAILNPTPAALAEAESNVTVSTANLETAQAKLGQLRGTVTWLPDEGAVVERGEPLYELDGQPSGILLYGARPAWRALSKGTEGPDVRQLQENLLELGFGDGDLQASGTFDDATMTAVKDWQASLSRAATGSVPLGDVVFQPNAIRVAAHSVALGDTVAGGVEVMKATTTDRVVSIAVSADDQRLVTVGDSVEVTLPDGTTTSGTVSDIGTVAQTDPNSGNSTVEVTVVLDDPASTGAVDQAPVEVAITTFERPDVLAVPVNALLALLEGGYAVEVLNADGTTHLVAVETGIFQDGWVEIDVPNGGLDEGDQLVVPA